MHPSLGYQQIHIESIPPKAIALINPLASGMQPLPPPPQPTPDDRKTQPPPPPPPPLSLCTQQSITVFW